jgi:type VI secretion system protein ImpH
MLAFYAGLLIQRPCSAAVLQAVLEDYFAVSVTVFQFVGNWLRLSEEDQSRLGDANSRLGVSSILGTTVWDAQIKFRLCIGPLTYTEFCDFLPIGSALPVLLRMIRFTVPQHLEFDIQLRLKAAEVPPCRLGGTEHRAPRLGWSTWLISKEFLHDVTTFAYAV